MPAGQSHGDMQTHIDIATGRVGVRADLMRGVHQALRFVLLPSVEGYVKVDIQAKTTGNLADAYMSGEQLLRVGCYSSSQPQPLCNARSHGGTGLKRLLRYSSSRRLRALACCSRRRA